MMRLYAWFKNLLVTHHLWDLFTYAFFGALTTLVNILSFGVAIRLGLAWTVANFIAWTLSVLFAFVTNKLWVFNSHVATFGALTWEFVKFVIARVASLALDYGCMFLIIDGLGLANMVAKILTQFAIVVANYALSKFIIFRNKPSDREQ